MSEEKKNFELFKGKTLSNLFEDIYKNSENTGTQVSSLVNQLKTFVSSLDSAVVIVPLIREYLDVKVKSDEQLVKLCDTIQRLLRSERVEDAGLISEEEKTQLLAELPDYDARRKSEDAKLKNLDDQVSAIKVELEKTIKTTKGKNGA